MNHGNLFEKFGQKSIEIAKTLLHPHDCEMIRLDVR
jgi:hypothetical protein